MRARLIVLTGIAAATITGMIVVAPEAASADPWDPSCSDSDDTCEVEVEIPGLDGGAGTDTGEWGGGGSSAGDDANTGPFADCTFTIVETDAKTHPIAGDRPAGDQALVVQNCTDANGQSIRRAQWVPVGVDGQVRLDPEILAQQAVDRLTLPRPNIKTSPESAQLVQLPTWLAVSESSWTVQTAEASLGDQVATATATPVQAVWDMGDGHTVTCTDRGAEWTRGTDPEAASDCGHTYTQPSADALEVQVTVTWRITWEVVWPGESVTGTAPDMTTSRTTNWLVTESHALVTR
jgi:hypothetical protein